MLWGRAKSLWRKQLSNVGSHSRGRARGRAQAGRTAKGPERSRAAKKGLLESDISVGSRQDTPGKDLGFLG